MGWFNRFRKGITTETKDKKEIKEGLWFKCPKCKNVVSIQEHNENYNVCECGYHEKISAKMYMDIIFDEEEKIIELNPKLRSADPLKFVDTKKYSDRLKATQEKTGLNDAISTFHGKVDKQDLVVAAMNFEFIGGSMGAVVGEKISRAIDYCIDKKVPLMIISKSGGARMMEAAYSLMQMTKTSAKLTQLADAKIPYISFLSDPTTGGVTASYAMLGDINISEPGALIAFAGPRVVKETIGKDLPEGFQTSEFVLEHGFLDYIVPRKELHDKLSLTLKMFNN